MRTGRPLVIRPVVMCKAPIPGHVKTRLIPELSAGQAAELYAAMARTVIERALRLFPNTWIAADDVSHPFFSGFAARLMPQGRGDLGERMLRMAEQVVGAGSDGVLIMGSDSPHMPDARLLAAMHALASHDVVLGPVEDGGYDLLGMRGFYPGLLDGVRWSTAGVLTGTLDHIRRYRLSVRCLSTAYDLDSFADVERARREGLRI